MKISEGFFAGSVSTPILVVCIAVLLLAGSLWISELLRDEREAAARLRRTALRTFATTYMLEHTGMMGRPDATEVRVAVERYFIDTGLRLYPEWEHDVECIIATAPVGRYF